MGTLFGRKSKRESGYGARLQIPPRSGAPTRRPAAANEVGNPGQRAAVVPLPPRRRWLRVLAVASVLIVVAAAVVAVVTVAGSDDRGGALTAEDAVRAFVERAEAGDLLGVLDLLHPAERDSMRDALRTLVDQAARTGALAAATDLGDLDEFAVRLEVSPDVSEVLADDLAAMSVSGSIAASLLISGRNPVGTENRTVEFRVMSVKVGDRWFVSLWYSLAENLRVRSGQSLSWAPAGAPTAVGAPTAIDAASAFLAAIERLSVAEVLAVLDPEEAEVLHRAAPWFVDGVQAAVDRWVAREGVSLRLSDPKFRAIRRGTAAIVTLEGMQGAIRTNDLDVVVRDGCAIFSSPGRADVRECLSTAEGAREAFSSEVVRLGVPQSVLRGVLIYDDLRVVLDDVAENGIAVRETGGRWFVRPTSSVLGLLTRAITNADEQAVSLIADDIESLVRVLSGKPASSEPADSSDEPDGSAGGDDGLDEYGRYNECFATGGYDDAVACVNAGLGAGLFARSIVSGTFLAPECGWKSLRFEPSLARLPGYQYVRRATAASTCMQRLVAQGLLAADQIPFELLRPQCLRGKNPSMMSSREAKAYIDCRLGS